MSTAHGQPGLSSDQRSTIRSTIFRTRHALEDEVRRQLEKYGIQEDKKLPVENLTHLSVEEIHTRRTLDAAIERELESTKGDLERSITNYVREATKTYLNRFVALKTIEVRGLVEETITERPEYGNRSYTHHTVAEIAGELTNAPDDGFGATLDLAYQEIGAEIRMIFEESEHTVIDLDTQVREEVLDELDKIEDRAWESDEALGWVYQYFGEEEREEIDERVDKENYKIAGTDIATKTQLFTPRYIVEWMVDNSLGRTWLEMQGERTHIADEENCFYLTPLKDSLIDREPKPVEEITVLDPACGSGHMLFYAFDVLYRMYLEEGEIPEKYIPRKILQNNLYGIDIDSGATQIAALALYLKAKEKSPDVSIPQLNIVSADAVLINGERKQEVLNKAESDLEEEILEQIWESFDNIREWGSLVQIEDQIDNLIRDYQEAYELEGQTQFTNEGDLGGQTSLVVGGEETTWEELRDRLIENVRELADSALERNNPVEELFAEEVEKSVRLLDLFLYDYDVVISNPPYLGSGKMGENLKNFVKQYHGNRDLCTAFIERCGKFADDENGYVSMITQENFTFLSSYSKLRSHLLDEYEFIDGLHLSRNSFDIGERPATIAFILRNQANSGFNSSRFYRMTHEQDNYKHFEDKISGLREVTRSIRLNNSHKDIYTVDQNLFKNIDGSPFVYWIDPEVLSIFRNYPKLGDSDVSKISGGIKSGDNTHFLRKFWEVPEKQIGDGYNWFVKGGEGNDFYDKVDMLIRWENDGQNIIDYCKEYGKNYQGLSNPGWYEERSIIFRDFSSVFVAKSLPEDTMFSSAVYRIKPESDLSELYLLGYLNSSLYRYIVDAINPSMHFKPGDAGSVPINTAISPRDEKEIEQLVQRCIEERKRIFRWSESGREFEEDYLRSLYSKNLTHPLLDEELRLANLSILHGKIDQKMFQIYNISMETQERIYETLQQNLANYPHITNAGNLDSLEGDLYSGIPKKELPREEYQELVDSIANMDGDAIPEISEKLNVSPYTVAIIRHEFDYYSRDKKREMAGRLLSYYLGCGLGRWNLDGIDSNNDGILGFEGDVMAHIHKCFESEFGEEEYHNKIQQIEEMLGREIDDWLRNRFFRYYHVDEYKRRGQRIPIYWQLESPSGAFSCFLYYHKIDENTLPKLRGQYLDPRINQLENELETLSAQTSGDNPDKELLKRKEKAQNDLDDIRQFRDTIDEMIDDSITVDFEKGIWENIKEWDQYEVFETGLPKLKSSYSR
ncbi:BREX-1 system adenine-specific DNA-methyltransferase PglX [Halorubrum ezzemoulense]|uniref:BREX-1 system adenine-specific DNA-methyltransferase PglX n=1 Tax=Halorubrum ezzemoulense TaxID=337243 RepID=UPI0023301FB8|nr:BREX-1 system adenine-specific DNA-methyltransferase PglX [Halorubrum ezzemoulense]MDB2247386.1 BREX-1 system adenine-specific DNA-methyltransferase PglX [Halorubrum ezzemoulense]